MFFEKTGPVWDVLRELENRLREAHIDYAVIGGLALNAYDYPRQTIDVDVVLTVDGFEEFKKRFAKSVYTPAEGAPRRFLATNSEVTIDVLIAGELAGHKGKNHTIRFPNPSEAEEHNDLLTVSLPQLIELKLVTWRYKDWGDVVELIRRHNLDKPFAEQLDPLVRAAYGECYDQANDPDYGPR